MPFSSSYLLFTSVKVTDWWCTCWTRFDENELNFWMILPLWHEMRYEGGLHHIQFRPLLLQCRMRRRTSRMLSGSQPTARVHLVENGLQLQIDLAFPVCQKIMNMIEFKKLKLLYYHKNILFIVLHYIFLLKYIIEKLAWFYDEMMTPLKW